jgi:transcriptional regulator with XRE-family HTH domain
MDKFEVGKRMRDRRVALGWAPKEAGSRIDISQQYLGRLEQGKQSLAMWETLFRICEVYGCSADWLLGLPNAPEPPTPPPLPEGGVKLLELMAEMSDRGRAELLTLGEALHDLDQEFERTAMLSNAIAALGGEALLDWVKQELALRTARLGSTAAAIADLRTEVEASLPAEESTDGQE